MPTGQTDGQTDGRMDARRSQRNKDIIGLNYNITYGSLQSHRNATFLIMRM